MEIQQTGILTLALILLGFLSHAFANQDATVIDQSVHDDIEDPNFHRFIRFLTKIAEQDAKEDSHRVEDKTRRSITEEKPIDEGEFSERAIELPPEIEMNSERAAAFRRLEEMLIKALELLEKENRREELTTERPAFLDAHVAEHLPVSLSADSQRQNDGNVLKEIIQSQNATDDKEEASKLPKRQLQLGEQLLGMPNFLSSGASSAASAASAASGSSAASAASAASASAFSLPVPLPLQALEELACDVEAVGFGHSHAIGAIVHEMFCEARKLWHYLLHALHNLKSEFSVGPQLNLAQAYATATSSSGFLERSPVILEELMKEPRHLLTLSDIVKDSVPLGSISKTLHRLKHALHKFLHVAKDLLLEKHHNTNLLQTINELRNLGLLEQLFTPGITWEQVATASATAASSATASASTQNLLLAVKSMYDGYHASGFPEIVQTATTAASTATSTFSLTPAAAPAAVPFELPTVLEEPAPLTAPGVLPSVSSSSASASSSATEYVVQPARIVEPLAAVTSSAASSSSSSPEGSSSSAASAASSASGIPIRQQILNRIRPFFTPVSPVITSAASSSTASSSSVQQPMMIPEMTVSSSSSSASSASIIEEPVPVEMQPVEEIGAPVAAVPCVPETVEEVVSSSSASASSVSSVPSVGIPEETVASSAASAASAVASSSSSSVAGFGNVLSQIRPMVAPLSNVVATAVEEGTLTSSLASLKQKHGHKSHEHKHHVHYKQHHHHHKHHKSDSSPTTVVLEEVVEEVPVVLPETPIFETPLAETPLMETVPATGGTFYGGSSSSSAASAASAGPSAVSSAASASSAISMMPEIPVEVPEVLSEVPSAGLPEVLEEVAPVVLPEVLEEVPSLASAAASAASVTSAFASPSSSSATGLVNVLSRIRPMIAPLSNVLSTAVEEGTLTSSLAALKEKHGHKLHEHKQHHKLHHKHHKDEPNTVIIEEVVEEVPVVLSETPVLTSSTSAAASAAPVAPATPLALPSGGYPTNEGAFPRVSPGISSTSAASSSSAASSGGSTSSSSSAASAAATGAGRRPSQQRLSLPLALPREMVVTALGEDVLLPGDIVTVTLRNRNVLAGRVIDSVSPINMYLLQPKLSAAIFRSGGRVWSLVPSDFRGSNYATLFDQY